MKWFSLSGILEETKKIRWPNRKDMWKDSETVVLFIFGFGVYFVFCELIVAQFLKLIGIGS